MTKVRLARPFLDDLNRGVPGTRRRGSEAQKPALKLRRSLAVGGGETKPWSLNFPGRRVTVIVSCCPTVSVPSVWIPPWTLPGNSKMLTEGAAACACAAARISAASEPAASGLAHLPGDPTGRPWQDRRAAESTTTERSSPTPAQSPS